MLRPEATLIRDAPAELHGMQGLTPSEQVQTTFAILFSLSPSLGISECFDRDGAGAGSVSFRTERYQANGIARTHITDINRDFVAGISCSSAVLPVPIKKLDRSKIESRGSLIYIILIILYNAIFTVNLYRYFNLYIASFFIQ